MLKPLVRGGAYVSALAACNALSGGSFTALLGLFMVAAAAIELVLPVVAADACPLGVRAVGGFHLPELSNERVVGLMATASAMAVAGVGLVFSAVRATAGY